MKKIINTYKQYEHFASYRAPEFTSNASEFHVMLWNLNFKDGLIGKNTPNVSPLSQKFVKDNREVFTKEFLSFLQLFLYRSSSLQIFASRDIHWLVKVRQQSCPASFVISLFRCIVIQLFKCRYFYCAPMEDYQVVFLQTVKFYGDVYSCIIKFRCEVVHCYFQRFATSGIHTMARYEVHYLPAKTMMRACPSAVFLFLKAHHKRVEDIQAEHFVAVIQFQYIVFRQAESVARRYRIHC